MPVPVFTAGETLDASEMNAVGLWRVTGCTVTSAGGTAATASNGVITVGTGNTSVTVANAFSADYSNYRIILEGVVGSVVANFTFQLSGITGAVYSNAGTFFNFGSTTVNGFGPAAGTSVVPGPCGTSNSSFFMDLTAPNAARRKSVFMQGSSTTAYYSFGGSIDSTSTATGFVLSTNGAGTITGGTIRVYGYRN
jgi:hypothetical protein